MKWTWFILFFSLAGFAKESEQTVRFLVFDPPAGWHCVAAGELFRCTPDEEKDRRDSVILLGLRPAPQDGNLETLAPAEGEQVFRDGQIGPVIGRVQYSVRRSIASYPWIDSLQWNTTVRNFWKRELYTFARIDDRRYLVFVSYLISERRYAAFAPILDRFANGLSIPTGYRDSNLSDKNLSLK